jgi:hypothetical protein
MDSTSVVLPGNHENEVLGYRHDHLPTLTMRTTEREDPLGVPEEDHLDQGHHQMSTRTFPHIIGMTLDDEEMIGPLREMTVLPETTVPLEMIVDAETAERIDVMIGIVAL